MYLNLELTEQQKLDQARFKLFAQDNIMPFADKWDSESAIPRATIEKLASAGFLNVADMDPLTFGLLCEELGKGSMSLISLLTVTGMVCQSIIKWGTQQQKEYWLPKIISGQKIVAFALTESNVGSDPKSIETTADLNNSDKFVINGKKKWISCAQIADLYLIIAQCKDKGPTAFLLERSTPGLTVTPINNTYGFRSAMLAELVFNNCEITEEAIVGRIGGGFSYVANTALDHGRYCVAWGCVGLGQACLDASLSYTCNRKQFGVYLRKHQLIQQMIANMATNIKAARALCLQAAYLKSISEPDLIMETSIAKYFASKMALEVANDAVQIHGANGCSDEFSVQRYLRDAKVTEIIEGSSQIQQIIISQYAYQRFLFESREQKKL